LLLSEVVFGHVDMRSLWNPKSGKFAPQMQGEKPDRPPDMPNTP
jgi:hypothetical protein